MKKIILLWFIISVSSLFALDGESLTVKCVACHGKNFEKSALGKSPILLGQSIQDIETALLAYRDGERNIVGLGALMKGQINGYTDEDIKLMARYITAPKSVSEKTNIQSNLKLYVEKDETDVLIHEKSIYWIKDNKACMHFNPDPKPYETLSWTGSCKGGYANGYGHRQWSDTAKNDGTENILLVKGVNPNNYIEIKGAEVQKISGIDGWSFRDFMIYPQHQTNLSFKFDEEMVPLIDQKQTTVPFHGKVLFYQQDLMVASYDGNFSLDSSKKIIQMGQGAEGIFTLWDGSQMKVKVTTMPDCSWFGCSGYYGISKPYIYKSTYFSAAKKEENSYYMREQQKQDFQLALFRRDIHIGDDTSKGLVLEVNENLVKVQTDELQCSQHGDDSSCKNWTKIPIEKWVKRKELFPK
jgi:cytochrome c553